MDFDNLYADETKILNVHYTKGRQGHTIDKVIIHHNDGNLTVDGCYDVWQTREASAHYQVCSDGTIGQLVYDKDTAWHAGNWQANVTSIGIEHADATRDPYAVSDACLDAGAHLVAAVCRFYSLGRPEWGVNLFGHSDFAPTECPASLAVGGSQHDEYVERCQSWYDQMTGTTPAPADDGSVGLLDGETGKLLVDGYFGPVTIKDLQLTMQFYGLYQGYLIDGDFAYYTKLELQKYLQRKGYYQGYLIDGDFSSYSVYALQQYLKDLGYYWYVYNGIRYWCNLDCYWGEYTTKALQRALNSERF